MGHVTLCKMCQKEVAPDKRADAIFAAMNAGYARTIARLGGETASERATSAASPPGLPLGWLPSRSGCGDKPRKRDRLPRRAVVRLGVPLVPNSTGWYECKRPAQRAARYQSAPG